MMDCGSRKEVLEIVSLETKAENSCGAINV